MLILGIETSCDETSAALVEDKTRVLSNIIHTQIPIHVEFGGVVPEIASRNHLLKVSQIVDAALDAAGKSLKDLDAIAVTKGPGLVGAILVGLNYGKALSYALDIPLKGINHLKGHLLSPLLSFPEIKPPFMSLVVSGGHTYIALCRDYDELKILGSTRDDAVGEAYDKVARTLGFEYPGGPKIDRAAKLGNKSLVDFPRAFLEEGSLDFSFSGIKSAVLNYVHNKEQRGEPIDKNSVAASFQEAVLEVLVKKSLAACTETGVNVLLVSGGVAANSRLRELLGAEAKNTGVRVYFPDFSYCTDNAAMIAAAAFYSKDEDAGLDLNADSSLGLA